MIQKLNAENFKREYGILCHRYYPNEETPTPFGATWCVVEPGTSTTPHDHFEGETFFIVEGRGLMTIDNRHTEVKAGDVVYIPPFSPHVLKNLSSNQVLTFVSVWWEDKTAQLSASEKNCPRTLVTVAPPTPNGDLHLGHLSGPYLASDIYNRFVQMNGVVTNFLSGSDDHQSYVLTKGRKLGLSPDQVVDRFSNNIRKTLADSQVALDYFTTPRNDPNYIAFVQTFFRRLVDESKIQLRDAETLHCPNCNLYLWEAHVRGLCPHCTAPTNGNGCEACGHFNDCVDLREPQCNQCDRPAARITRKRFYFPLSEYRSRLATFLDKVEMNPRTSAFTRELLNAGLTDFSASHFADWGIPVPIEGFEDQVIYDWLEMAAGYLYAAERVTESADWRTLWKNPNARVVQFFGFDNSFFYTTLIPAVMMAFDSEITLPYAFVNNEFYRLDGKKFSTSRNHAIWGDEIIPYVAPDVIRFYLAYSRPEMEQTNFTIEDFRNTVERELVRSWEPWFHELQDKIDNAFGGKAPSHGTLTAEQKKLHEFLVHATAEMKRHYDAPTFSLNCASRLLARVVEETKRFSESSKFLQNEIELRDNWQASVTLELTALKALALMAYPILPTFGAKILQALGESTLWDKTVNLIEEGRPIYKFADNAFSAALAGIDRFCEINRLNRL